MIFHGRKVRSLLVSDDAALIFMMGRLAREHRAELTVAAVNVTHPRDVGEFDNVFVDCIGLQGVLLVAAIRQELGRYAPALVAILNENAVHADAPRGATFLVRRTSDAERLRVNLKLCFQSVAGDKRGTDRVAIEVPAVLRDPVTQRQIFSSTRDLTCDGVCVNFADAAQLHTPLDITIQVAENIHVHALAEIAWTADCRIGMRFADVSHRSRRTLREFLQKEGKRRKREHHELRQVS